MDNSTVKSVKQKKVLQAVFVSLIIICLSILVYLVFGFVKNKNKQVIEKTNIQTSKSTNFPIERNQLGYYSFMCEVENIFETNTQIKLNKTVFMTIECNYYDLLLKPHKISVPLIIKNENGEYLAANRVYGTEFSEWTLNDYMNNISRFYYLESADENSKENYDNPQIESYQRNSNLKKPTISKGDLIAINFVLEDGLIEHKENFVRANDFSKDYLSSISTYENIKNFIDSGQNPEILYTENGNLIIPSWVSFTEDNNL